MFPIKIRQFKRQISSQIDRNKKSLRIICLHKMNIFDFSQHAKITKLKWLVEKFQKPHKTQKTPKLLIFH